MNAGMTTSGFTVWFTGMAGSGKSTLATHLSHRLKRMGAHPEILDGGDLGEMLSIGKAETKEERNADCRRLAWLCKLITRGGGIVLMSAIQNPYRDSREDARHAVGRFVEVFVDCNPGTLIARDRTGIYKKALSGEIKNLPGITEPYEPPAHPEVLVDTAKMSIDQAIEHIMGQLVALRLFDPSDAGLKSRPKLTALSKLERPLPLKPTPGPVHYKAPPPVVKSQASVLSHAKVAAAAKKHDAKVAAAPKPSLAKKGSNVKSMPKAKKTAKAAHKGKSAKVVAHPTRKLAQAKKAAARQRPEPKRAVGDRKR